MRARTASSDLGFGDGQAERLFAEHVLAGLGGLDGPGHVKLIGQRVVDGVDFGVGEQLLVGAVGLGNAERGCRLLRLGEIARSDGGDGEYCPRCMPGMTFLRPILAVLRTPQRSFFAMAGHDTPAATALTTRRLSGQRRFVEQVGTGGRKTDFDSA